jgi:hypothetical protein
VIFPATAARVHAQTLVSDAVLRASDADRYPEGNTLLDRAHYGLHSLVWHSAMLLDRMFGPPHREEEYQEASGSVAVAVLWNQFDHFQTRTRFRVNLPVPRLSERFHAFIGRVNRDEYVTERTAPSGAFPLDRGFADEDETLAGLNYRAPSRRNGSFDAGAGLRLRSPLDPYVKAGYRYHLPVGKGWDANFKETLFWQNSEKFGATSRVEFERMLDSKWDVRWTLSGTISQKSAGVRGYSTLRFSRMFSTRRAVIIEAGIDGESRAPVALHEFGLKVAYRRSIIRNWLVLETRTSVTWPQEFPDQSRKPSWGIGIGVEMFYGTEAFTARTVTF